MPEDQRERLRRIRTFPSLVKYLHDELDWPISPDDFEDQTFDYSPEELGIDSKNAAKIQDIKRLRPLTAKQPWGIFFVKFEPKRLPVVALRRILNQVVLKKRASANSVERAAWELDDLLFISNYGDGDERKISFAHFKQEEEKYLPSLKVLGWDNLDTALHLDHLAYQLKEKLHWPSDEDNAEKWREDWRSVFTVAHREVITTSRALAIRLAELARAIRDRTRSVLEIETEDGPVTKLMDAFKESLIHDLDEDDFADMYAQTITYGLLSARIANPDGDNATDSFSNHLSVTNPFLRELMETFLHTGTGKVQKSDTAIDFDELGVSEVVDLLDNANMEAVVMDFGDRNPQEDPVIHFYELFLKEYDAKKRMQRGVFYTPRPVVSFIVRSVDELLKTEFGLEDGLADTTTWGEMAEKFDDLEIPEGATLDQAFVQILDPATGTGTFLVEVIDVIYNTMREKWEKEHGPLLADVDKRWNEYVPKHLLPRLFGYELLMAPYAIAHMKIGLKLHETKYRFKRDERVRVYLTNSLEPAQDFSGKLAFAIPALAHEAEAVNAIKRYQRFTIVIGNPPYSKSSANRSESAENYVRGFKEAVKGERNVQPLSDDYIKFLAYCAELVGEVGGIIGMITNRSYLGGLIHRGIRREFLNRFNEMWLIDLHGDSNVGENVPEGLENDNVFEITQGVAISLLICNPRRQSTKLHFSELWGSRESKYSFLAQSLKAISCVLLIPEEPYWFFTRGQYIREEGWIGLDDLFIIKGTGIKSRRDHFMITMDRNDLRHRFEKLITEIDIDKLHSLFGVTDNTQWTLSGMRELVRKEGVTERIIPIQYRPFDERYIWYHPKAIERGDARWPVMRHVIDSGISLLSSRQSVVGPFTSAFIVYGLSEMKTAENTRGSYVFPLMQNKIVQGCFLDTEGDAKNYRVEVLGKFLKSCEPLNMLGYIYAILYSPTYRKRYSSILRIEFPKIPIDVSETLGKRLCTLGSELIGLHLLNTSKCCDYITTLVCYGEFHVEKVTYSDETVWIDKAKTKGFKGVPEEVWNFHIGGYQVCHKWLKDRQAKGGKNPRPGRILSDGDIEHYQKIVVALNETIRIMKEIDEVIEDHGGWPGAFVTGESVSENDS